MLQKRVNPAHKEYVERVCTKLCSRLPELPSARQFLLSEISNLIERKSAAYWVSPNWEDT